MVISGTNAGVFCHDFGTLMLNEVTASIVSVEMRLMRDGVTLDTIVETYTPDANGIIQVNGLGELAKSYFPEQGMVLKAADAANIQRCPATITMQITVSDAEGVRLGTATQTFYYANCRTNIADPYKYMGFLTRHRRYKVRPDQSVNLSCLGLGQLFGLGISYLRNGVEQWIELAYALPDNGYIITRSLRVADVLDLLPKQNSGPQLTIDCIRYYIAYTKHDGQVVDAVQYDVDRRHFPAITQFAYYNCFGCPETLYFTGSDERSTEIDATIAKINGQHRKIKTNMATYHGINTGYINETLRDCVEDLVHSSRVYLVDNDILRDMITITEVDFSENKPRTEPINIKMTYRVANEVQRTCDRDPSVDFRIFDHTFGDEFE